MEVRKRNRGIKGEIMRILYSKYGKTYKDIYKDIAIKFISILIKAVLISIFIWCTVWSKNRDLIHSALEISSVCIGIATFLIIWNKRESEKNINDIVGFGFLMVAIFDFMHSYYYNGLIVDDIFKTELSIRFWLIARLIEVTILMVFSFAPYLKNISRNITIIGTIIITSGLFYVLYALPGWFPILRNTNGITETKAALEYLVIAIAMVALFQLNNNLQKGHIIKFNYLYMCILLIIPSEFCFTIFNNSGSFFTILGHVLKIFSYFYLYKGVFQSLINYPYDKLGENNQRLFDILNAIPIAIQTYNVDDNIDFVNKKFEELFKCPKENILGLNHKEVLKVLNLIESKSPNILKDRGKDEENNTKTFISSHLGPDGKEMKVLINIHAINGGLLVLSRDVKQEQEIKNLNLQAQIILNAVMAPTMILDVEGKIVACNSSYADLIEVERKDIIDMNIYELYNKLKSSANENIHVCNNNELKNKVTEWSIETPKGNKKQLRITRSSIKNIYNENIGIVSVAQDISKMKEDQQKLINQEKLALLGQMGATIVHETRNYLTTIKGNSQLIELYVDDERIKNYARKINVNTNEVNKIISDFLSLSKPRETELEEVAFNDMISSMKDTIETSSLMQKVELKLDLDYDERYILCDETQIRQVILNICKNAVEAMDDILNPVLHIRTGLDECKKEVFINISDNGRGIDNETIKKIGTPFFTTKKTGTGLGLSACYQIIREHKGRIDVTSNLGEGTTFTIAIPYLDDELEDLEDII